MSVVPSPRGPVPPESGAGRADTSGDPAGASPGEASGTLDTTASHAEDRPPAPERAAPSLRVFEDDELVAFRYRIRGLLGRGGMGEVYDAEDLELRERIALKVLRRELAERPGALEQLKRESALARKVSSPHVCRLFDVGFHLRPSTRGPERICFLTMELLPGESLSARLRRSGGVPVDEVLPLARQLCEGLHAAHEAGIVHRDLKSANVLLVPGQPGAPPRAVITDFGLARLAGEATVAPGEPEARRVGTPAYMAPEQLEGRPITPATDLYALGLILFELLTGTRPFQGEDAWSTAHQRLHTPAPSPRALRPGLDRRWEALVLRCLERAPERRFQHARELLAALPAPRRAPRLPPPLRDRSRSVLTLLALAMGGLVAASHVQTPGTAPTRPALARRSVALLGFVDRTGRPDTAWLSTLLVQALSIELRADERIRFASGGDTAKAALSLRDAESLPPETLARLHELLGSELVLLGAYAVEGPAGAERLRLDLRLQDTTTGATVARVEERGPLDTPLPLFTRAGGRLREALGVRGVSLSPPLESILPSRLQALRLYDEGMARLRQRDAASAQALFERVIALEPTPSLPHARLASTLVARGERTRAQQEFRELLSHPERLNLKGRLTNGALSARYAPDWKAATELSRRYVELFPDEPEGWVNLADIQLAAGDAAAALDTLAKLRERAPPAVLAVTIDVTEAKAALGAQELPRAQAAAARAAAQAEAWKDWSSAGVNRALEAEIHSQQGARERARETMRAAIQLFHRAGNRSAEADAIRELMELLPAGDLRGRLQVAREAKALYAGLGQANGLCMTLLDIADHEYQLGEPSQALRSAREALPLCRGTRLPNLESRALELMGGIQLALGGLDAAEATFGEQLRLARERLARENRGTGLVALGLSNLAELALARGELAEARRLLDEARTLPQKQGRRAPEDLELRLARLAFEEGQLDEAGRLADVAVTSVPERVLPELHLLRARVFLARHQYKEANVALLEAGEPPAVPTWLGLKVQGARLRAARGEGPEREAARTRLQELLARAEKAGWLEGQYEARLALAEVELASGSTAAGRARLEALEREARRRGWRLWALKASRLR